MPEYQVTEFDGISRVEFTTPLGVECSVIVDFDVSNEELLLAFIDQQTYAQDERLKWLESPTKDAETVRSINCYMNTNVCYKLYSEGQQENSLLKGSLVHNFPEYNQNTIVENGPQILSLFEVTKTQRFFMGELGDNIILCLLKTDVSPFLYYWGANQFMDREHLAKSFVIYNNTVTKKKNLRVYFPEVGRLRYFRKTPDLPNYLRWEASRLISQEGEILESEIYLFNDHEFVEQFCSQNGFQFPNTQDNSIIPYAYSVVFNEETGDPTGVRAYAYEYL